MLLFYFSSTSPRNDGASIGVLGLVGPPIGVLALARASFEAARKYDGRGEHRHCEARRLS